MGRISDRSRLRPLKTSVSPQKVSFSGGFLFLIGWLLLPVFWVYNKTLEVLQMILNQWKNLPPIILQETPNVKVTEVEIEDLTDSELKVIILRVYPSRVWRRGDVLVVAGFRDYYEFQEVRKRIVGGLKRFFVKSIEDCDLCSDDNLVRG